MYFAKAHGGSQAIFYSKDLLTQTCGKAAGREDNSTRTGTDHIGTGEDLR